MNRRSLAMAALAAVLFTGAVLAADAAPAKSVAEVVKAAMDPAADPCQDFYRYACGGWLDTTKLPGDQVRWGRGFSEIAERNRQVNRDILDDAVKNPGSDPDRQKLGSLYGSCMDEAAIEKAGIAPIEPLLAAARRVKDSRSLRAALALLHQNRIWGLFRLDTDADFKEASRVILYLQQDGLGLPDRDYYLDKDLAAVRDKYQHLVEKGFYLMGQPAATFRVPKKVWLPITFHRAPPAESRSSNWSGDSLVTTPMRPWRRAQYVPARRHRSISSK